MSSIFDLINHGPFTKGRIRRIVIEPDMENADIEYEVGADIDGTFKAFGVDHLHLADVAEQKDPEGRGILSEAKTDYTDFRTGLEAAKSITEYADGFLRTKGVAK